MGEEPLFNKITIKAMDKQKVKITGPNEGETVSVVGDTYRILTSGNRNNSSLACIEMLIPPGGGPGPHAHAGFYEFFYIIDGELIVRSEGQEPYTAKKGAFVEIPKGGIIHNFKNESETVTHILLFITPSGLEDFFKEIGKPVKWREFLPVHEPTEEEKYKLEKTAEQHGQQIYPPGYLGS